MYLLDNRFCLIFNQEKFLTAALNTQVGGINLLVLVLMRISCTEVIELMTCMRTHTLVDYGCNGLKQSTKRINRVLPVGEGSWLSKSPETE